MSTAVFRLSWFVSFVVLTLAVSLTESSCGNNKKSNPGGSSGSSAKEILYVTSAANSNTSAWVINPDASLTAVSGSPFAVGGQNIAANSAATSVFTLTGTSPSNIGINTDTVGSDDSLKVASNVGDNTLSGPISINPAGTALYVASISAAQGNYGWKIYSIQGDGTLTFNTGIISQVAGRLSFTPDGSNAYSAYCYHLAANIQHYTVASDGSLTLTNDSVSQIDSSTECPNAVAVTADGKTLAAVWSNADNVGAADNRIVVYNIDPSTHALTAISGSPFSASGVGTDVTFDSSGKFLVVAQDNGVSVYQVNSTSVTEVSGSPFASGTNFNRVMFSPSGASVVGVSRSSGSVSVFKFDGSSGMLTPGSGSPMALSGASDLTVIRH